MLTYTTVIAIALDSAPDKRLPLREIYRFFTAHADSIPLVNRPNWKNSVRHTLSGHPCFDKVPPPPGAKASRTWLLIESKLPRCSIQPLSAYRDVMGRASANRGGDLDRDRFDRAMTEVSRLDRPSPAAASPPVAAAATASANAARTLDHQHHQQSRCTSSSLQEIDEGSAVANIILAHRMKEEQQRLLSAQDVDDVHFADTGFVGEQHASAQPLHAVSQLIHALQPDALNRLLGDIANLMHIQDVQPARPQPQHQQRQQQHHYQQQRQTQPQRNMAKRFMSPLQDPDHGRSSASSHSPATLSVSGASPGPGPASNSAMGGYIDNVRTPVSHGYHHGMQAGVPTHDTPAFAGLPDPLLASLTDEELALLSGGGNTDTELYDFHELFSGRSL